MHTALAWLVVLEQVWSWYKNVKNMQKDTQHTPFRHRTTNGIGMAKRNRSNRYHTCQWLSSRVKRKIYGHGFYLTDATLKCMCGYLNVNRITIWCYGIVSLISSFCRAHIFHFFYKIICVLSIFVNFCRWIGINVINAETILWVWFGTY